MPSVPPWQQTTHYTENMKFTELPLKGAYIIEPSPFKDNRGLFERLFCREEFEKIGHRKEIVQINHSITNKKAAVRGMHFQHPPHAEIKIIKALRGSVFDVIIDIRKNSSTFLKWHSEIISGDNLKMMYVPEGFAHGFQTLEDACELLYLHTALYNKQYEGALRFDDPEINVTWPLPVAELSDRDSKHPLIDESFSGIEI